jgi:hypothetical protein
MKARTQTTTLACLVVFLVATVGNAVIAQSGPAKATRQSDVIYGRKFGGGAHDGGVHTGDSQRIGVLWVVSSSGRSSRDQTLQGSFERRIAPLLEHGYTIFAVIHGSAPAFNVQDQVNDVRRAVRFVRHRAAAFGIDGQRLGIVGSSSGGLLALEVAMQGRDGETTSADEVERESGRVRAVGCFFPPTDLENFGGSAENVVDLMRKRDGSVDPTFQFYDVDAKTGAVDRSPRRRRYCGCCATGSAVAPAHRASE